MAEEIEPQRRDTLFAQHPGQDFIRRTIFAGQKSMAQHGQSIRGIAWSGQDPGHAMAETIAKDNVVVPWPGLPLAIEIGLFPGGSRTRERPSRKKAQNSRQAVQR